MGNKMWLVSISGETGPTFRALVRADKMEEAMAKAREAAEEAEVTESGISIKNMGSWPTVIIE